MFSGVSNAAIPDIFSTARTNLVKDADATMSNMKLLLASWKKSLIGDPYFGTNLKKFIHEQNNIVLRDLIIDEIYVSLQIFMPQVYLKRKDITITQDKTDVYATINCINKLDNEVNMYQIKLTTDI